MSSMYSRAACCSTRWKRWGRTVSVSVTTTRSPGSTAGRDAWRPPQPTVRSAGSKRGIHLPGVC